MDELFCEILSICRKIDQQTKAQCFFEYFGHTNNFVVMCFRDGWRENMTNDEWMGAYITDMSEYVCMTSLVNAKEKLLKIAAELGVEL